MDSSQPRRIVLLIDLHPLENPNSSSYVSSILHSATKVLTFPPLSTSLFAIKPFFSSLSPFKSTSLVQRLLGKSSAAASPSFDLPTPTLLSLAQTLKPLSFPEENCRRRPPRAELVAGMLHELGLRCAWDDKGGDGGPCGTTPNLVLLFSPLPRSRESAAEFVDAWVEDDSMVKIGSFCDAFSRIFSCANGVLVRSDVHLSWVDVEFDLESGGEIVGLELVKRGIGSMGWGFCSTDAIVLGSVLVPFGSIFPELGCKLGVEMNEGVCSGRVEFSLEISDSSGRPLESKFCDLEVLDLRLQKGRPDIASIFSNDAGNVKARMCLKEVWRVDEGVNLNAEVCRSVLLYATFGKSGEDEKKEAPAEFFADRVLKLLDTKELCKFVVGTPFWQLVLAFLHRRNLWASVSISGRDEGPLVGIIKPFTVHSAILSVLRNTNDLSDISKLLCIHSVSETTGSEWLAERGKKSKKHLGKLSNLSWSSFRESVFSQTNDIALGVDLEEIYFAKEKNIPKKMRFVRVWMKQMKHQNHSQIKINNRSHQPDALDEAEEGTLSSQQETDFLVSSSPIRETQLSQAEIEDHPVFESVQYLESFNEKISEKINDGLCSEEVDLRQLAERLVELTIRTLYVKFKNNKLGDLASAGAEENHDQVIAAEVMKALLTKPKVLAAKYKDPSPLATTSSQVSGICSKKVREHELQILFRMEVLRSSIGTWVEENTRAKIIKEICLLLENIEFNLQGGLFAGESLIEFCNRTLKARYFRSLGDVIQRIYTQMEFFNFDGGNDGDSSTVPCSTNNDEAPLDRENNSISKDAILGPNEIAIVQDKTSMVNHSYPHTNDACKVAHPNESELIKAQEKRERDRTNKRFTSWMPNLQIVYAPKQSKAGKSMHGLVSKQPGRKRSRTSHSDMVLETPMTGKTSSQSQEVSSTEKHGQGGSSSKQPLAKALFRDEDD